MVPDDMVTLLQGPLLGLDRCRTPPAYAEVVRVTPPRTLLDNLLQLEDPEFISLLLPYLQ